MNLHLDVVKEADNAQKEASSFKVLIPTQN